MLRRCPENDAPMDADGVASTETKANNLVGHAAEDTRLDCRRLIDRWF